MQEPFTNAPYVHPSRAPSYFAQQLRAMNFAKATNKRLLWIIAHDVPSSLVSVLSGAKQELRKMRWLEFHDRFTSGIPGVFPLVLDLPVRFTDTPYGSCREQGVFKNARGWLRGWKLSEEVERRLEESSAPEVVLRQRPLQLFIEVISATSKMPLFEGKRIYILNVHKKQWSIDGAGKVPIIRYGFPLVPDFGGTAHAYCGSTLMACIGDLLAWHARPRQEDAQKGYIIKSRTRDAAKMLLAQPYCPMLFRQGVQEGPQLLLQVLRGEITTAEAKVAW